MPIIKNIICPYCKKNVLDHELNFCLNNWIKHIYSIKGNISYLKLSNIFKLLDICRRDIDFQYRIMKTELKRKYHPNTFIFKISNIENSLLSISIKNDILELAILQTIIVVVFYLNFVSIREHHEFYYG